jgi:RNase adaptor protein for sRNA GlmZ degradation
LYPFAGEDNVKFVKIEASSDTLLDRVENKDQAKYSKINSKSVLTRFLEENNWSESIEKTNSLIISTDNLTPDEAVQKIIEEYDL